MLKMTRKAQQGVVIYPKRATTNPITIRVTEIIPGTVGLGFEGLDYEVVRSEIYTTERIETDADICTNKAG